MISPRIFRTSLSSHVLAATAALLLAGCGAANFGSLPATPGANQVKLEGFVHGGQQPIVGATVQLYTTGTTADQSASAPLIAAAPLTDSAGGFNITGLYTCPSITAEVYLIASGGNPGLAPLTNNHQSVLMAALGPCGNLTSATHIIINEVTTIGSIYPITPYMSSYLNVGAAPANQLTLAADFMQINQFIDTNGGQSPGPALPGGFTAPVANLNTLANSMSDCVNSPGGAAPGGVSDGTACGNFLQYATPPGGPAPTNTADAILDIANNPFQNVNSIYLLSSAAPAFQPVLSAAPPDWTLKILPNVTLTTTSTLVGVGSSLSGSITLGQAAPAGGLTVNLVSSNTGFVTVVTPVNIPAGATTGSFTVNGVAQGTATITASATGYYPDSLSLTATTALISLGSIPVVAPGQSTSLPLSIGIPAPVGGLTVNFTSTAAGVATVTGSSFIPAGLQIPSTNPQVTGVTVGTATINATATGFAPGARNVSVSVTASFQTPFSAPLGNGSNEVLTVSAPAPAGGITFSLSVDTPALMSVPTTVTVPAGATSVNVPIDGLAAGTTNLRADSPNITEAVAVVTINSTISNYYASVTTGTLLDSSDLAGLGTTPAVPTTITVTSNNPGIFLVSTSPTVAGAASITFTNVTSTAYQTIYVQGVAVGSGTYTVSATGYTSSSVPVTVVSAGFVLSSSNFSTSSLSPPTPISLSLQAINPATGANVGANVVLGPAAGTVGVPVASSNTAAGTVTTPANFAPGSSTAQVSFAPVNAGTTNLSITAPAGFSTPTPASTQQITATVTSTPVNFYYGSSTTGVLMQTSNLVGLSQTPPAPVAVTVTVADPTVAVLSASPTVAGGANVVFNSTVSTSYQTFYIQGLKLGNTTMTVSAPGYSPTTVPITINPSGFYLSSGNFSTTTFSSPTTLQAAPAVLSLGTLTYAGGGTLAPQAGTVNVTVASATTSVGTVTSPVAFPANSTSGSFTFTPAGAGTSNITLTQPAGFSTPSNASQQLTATVTAPAISWYYGSNTTGVNLQTSNLVGLGQTPPTAVTVTVVSSNPAVATVSASSSLAGAASITFPNTVSTSYQSLSIQGQMTGTSTLTVSAPGYTPANVTVTVLPSGFIFASGNFSTTTFSSPNTVTVQPVALNTGTLTYQGAYALNPGIGSVSVPVSSSSPQVGTVTTPATFAAGSSSATATFTPLAAGATNISIGTPAGYSTPAPSSTQQVTATVTAPLANFYYGATTTGVNLQTANLVGLGQAPPSAVTVTVTSASPSIATISTSPTVLGTGTITFPNTSSTSYQTFYVQGHVVGTTTLTVSAPGYQNTSITVTIDPSGFAFNSSNFSTTTFSSPTTVSVYPVYLNPGTLTIAGGGNLAPGVGMPAIAITSGTTSVGTITSPITFNVNNSQDTATFTPVGAGTTTLSIATPAGYSTPSAQQSVTATVTAPPVNFYYGSTDTGMGMQQLNLVALTQTPPTATNVTVSVTGAAGLVALSKSLTVAGSSSITFNGVTNTSYMQFYIQGLATSGSTTLTVSATGFASTSITVTLYPTGFIFASSSFTTNTFSAPNAVTASAVLLNGGLLTYHSGAIIGPGGAISVPIVSSAPGVGTVASPIVFNPGDTSDSVLFTPIGNGATNLTISTPAGFSTPSQQSNIQITATVTAPNVNFYYGSINTGINLETLNYVSLGQVPPAPVTMTVMVADPTVAVVSTSLTTIGSGSIAFASTSSTALMPFYIQGLKAGTTTMTVSAPGFASTTITITSYLSGFVFSQTSSTINAGSSTAFTAYPVMLQPGVLTVVGASTLAPQAGAVMVPIGSTSPQIATVSTGNLSFTPGQTSASFTVNALTSGTTDIDLVNQPSGFTTPSQPSTQQIVITVP